MPKSDFIQNNFTNGELSPNALGRFDISKYKNSAKIIENFMLKQLGGAMFRPGTKFIYATKTSDERSRLLKFQYSTDQSYVIEAGDLYFRFYTDSAILLDPVDPVEVVTPFELANLTKIKYAQNADTMYIATGVYPIYKLQRTSATTFTLTEVSFVRGPFLDTNITATTITPSADTGVGITLTASVATFTEDHIGSLWRIKSGVAKITAWASTTSVTATVQAEPDGTAGNLATSLAAVTDWAEGSWSAERGYPSVVTFHEGRLYFGKTTNQPNGVWGSVPFAYESFEGGADDDNAINIELNADTVVSIRWFSSGPKSLDVGTTGGIFNIGSGANQQPITPLNIKASRGHLFGAADIQAKRLFNYVYFVQNDLQRFLESGYFFDVDANDANDATLLADHILGVHPGTSPFPRGSDSNPGAFEIDAQQSPNNRIWIIRNDGQICILTRNVRQEVNGWCRFIAGETISCDGESGKGQFESIAIIPQDGEFDQVWVIVNRIIDETVKRFVEVFTSEDFKYEWDPVRLDSSLTLDSPITITAITFTDPITITTLTAHGFSNGDQVKFDNIIGTHQLNGTIWTIQSVATDTFKLDTEVT